MDHPALETLFSSSPGTKQDADRKFFYTAFITSEPANLTMPDTADPAETLGLIKGLAEVVKSQHSAHKAEQEAHLKAMKATNEHISNLTATVEGLSKQIPKSHRFSGGVSNNCSGAIKQKQSHFTSEFKLRCYST